MSNTAPLKEDLGDKGELGKRKTLENLSTAVRG